MASKPIGPQLRLEVPDHDTVVKRARDELFHVRVEADRGNRIAMTTKGALKGRILSDK